MGLLRLGHFLVWGPQVASPGTWWVLAAEERSSVASGSDHGQDES